MRVRITYSYFWLRRLEEVFLAASRISWVWVLECASGEQGGVVGSTLLEMVRMGYENEM